MLNDVNEKEILWSQKYRPRRIDDIILPAPIKATFSKYVADGSVPNLLLSGGPGIGKTTVAKAMLNELGLDNIVINGSLESGIDVLRGKISSFASSVSLQGGRKYVIIDESEYLNPQSVQPALRAFMEDYSKNCGFIFTCNYKNRIIEPLRSRLSEVDFSIDKGDKNELAGLFFKRVIEILNAEGVSYDKKVVVNVILKYFPDFRRTINELQRYSASGKIDEGIFVDLKAESIDLIFDLMRDKKFTDMRQWVADNADQDASEIFRRLYEVGARRVDLSTQPGMIIALADYQYKHAFAADSEINLMAALTEIMMECEIS